MVRKVSQSKRHFCFLLDYINIPRFSCVSQIAVSNNKGFRLHKDLHSF